MSEYTPTAEEADRFIEAMRGLYQAEMTNSLVADEDQLDYYGKAFDKFMATHDAQVRQEAEQRGKNIGQAIGKAVGWDACAEEVHRQTYLSDLTDDLIADNPYYADQTEQENTDA